MVTKIQTFQAGSGDFCEIGSRRISVVSDQANGFGYSKDKTDSFVVAIEGFSHSLDKDSNPNSLITLQRNLSRKGSSQGAGEKRTSSSPTSNERDQSLVSVASSSPKALMVESNTAEVALGAADHSTNSPSHHQITITTGSVGTNSAESKWNNRRSYSFRRPPPTWVADPRKILIFFATLSSMGTMLLIFLTLSMREAGVEYGKLE